MGIVDSLSLLLIAFGAGFFVAGTVGMIRFPDVYSRVHALTKADNVGLGFLVIGLIVHEGTWGVGIKLVLIWVLVMLSSATTCYLVARCALSRGLKPWRRSAP